MEAKGANLLIKPEPSDRVLESGIIIPDTLKPKNKHWARVLQTNDYIVSSNGDKLSVGAKIMFIGENKEKEQVINNRQVLYWINE